MFFLPYMVKHICLSSETQNGSYMTQNGSYMTHFHHTVYDYLTVYDSPYMSITVWGIDKSGSKVWALYKTGSIN